MFKRSIEFQQKAITSMNKKLDIIINADDVEKLLLLESPVGSGKTAMCGMLMDRIIETHPNKKVGFIWLSPGKGSLANQSRKSIQTISTKVRTESLDTLLTEGSLQPNVAVFINWESVRSEDINVARKMGESTNLESCIEDSDLDYIVTFIDEAHEASATTKSNDVLAILNSTLVVELTATPRNLKKYNDFNTVKVPLSDVKNEGFLKKKTFVNKDLDSTDRLSILKAAINKQRELEEEFDKVERGINLVPLCLIQIQNDSQVDSGFGDKVLNSDLIRKDLVSLGVADKDIALKVSNDELNYDDIQNSSVRFLIFKQAIATGWDAPRSHILVKLRDVKSMTFDIQTIGRILRTVEKKHYDNAILDNAYIFTEFETMEYKVDDAIKADVITDASVANLKPEFPNFVLPMERVIASKPESLLKEINNELKTRLSKTNFDVDYIEDAYSSFNVGEIDTSTIFNSDALSSLVGKQFKLSTDQLYFFYRNSMRSFSHYNGLKILRDAVKYKYNISDIEFYKLFRLNQETFINMFKESVNSITKLYKVYDSVVKDYVTPSFVTYSDAIESTKRYAYDKKPNLSVKATGSSSESKFGAYLDEHAAWWYKNGVRNNHFGIVYEYKEDGIPKLQVYYPDFIACSKSGVLYILDTKAPLNSKDFEHVDDKYNASKRYARKYEDQIKQQGFTGVVCSMIKYTDKDGNVPYICKTPNYTGDVKEWEEFVL